MGGIQKKFKKALSIDFLPLIIAYVVLIAFFAMKSEHFFTVKNFLNIALYAANAGILACTMTLVIVAGHIDLSVGSVIALAGVVMGKVMQSGAPMILAVLACLAVGALTGLYNAILITKIHINAFITTLAGMEIFRGCAYLVTNGKALTLSGDFIKAIGRGYTLGIPNAVIIQLIYGSKNRQRRSIIRLATRLPATTEARALRYFILSSDATAHPVHTPVRGRGIATKRNTPSIFLRSVFFVASLS